MTAWRTDPHLAPLFHPEYPDDLQVLVHDGEPRRSGRKPEGCWVRVGSVASTLRFAAPPPGASPPVSSSAVRWTERPVYCGKLLNQPHHLTGTAQGDDVLFVFAPGIPCPVQVTRAYLAERPRWAIAPCDKCGADQALDPPTIMAQTRFPNAPAGALPIAFTAFCPCGGTMVLSILEGAPPAPTPDIAAKKPWWKIW